LAHDVIPKRCLRVTVIRAAAKAAPISLGIMEFSFGLACYRNLDVRRECFTRNESIVYQRSANPAQIMQKRGGVEENMAMAACVGR
jgi:hypothetical protein